MASVRWYTERWLCKCGGRKKYMSNDTTIISVPQKKPRKEQHRAKAMIVECMPMVFISIVILENKKYFIIPPFRQ